MRKYLLIFVTFLLLCGIAFALNIDLDGNNCTDIPYGGTNASNAEEALENLGGVKESDIEMGGCSGAADCTAEEIMQDQTVDYGSCTHDYSGCQMTWPDAGMRFADNDDPDTTLSGQIRLDHNGAGKTGQKTLRLYDQDLTAQVVLASTLFSIPTVTIISPNDLADATRDKLKIWDNDTGMTFVVTQIIGGSDTDDTSLNVEEYDADGESNNATVDALEIATGTSWFTQTETSITGPNIEAGHGIWLDFDDTDTPGQVTISISGYFLSDVN